MGAIETLTERQRKWFASVKAGLEEESGRTLAEWAELARGCPETAHRKRLGWMKEKFGLGQNRASMVLDAAFPSAGGWSDPKALAGGLWVDPTARAIFERVRGDALALPGTIEGQRKMFSAFSRKFQFAALKPTRGGVMLGLAAPPSLDPRLEAAGKEGWSERLHSRVRLTGAEDVAGWLRAAWERS